MIEVEVDHSDRLGPSRNQGKRPTCLAFAASDLNAFGHSTEHLSVEYLCHFAAKSAEGWQPGDGFTTEQVFSALARSGQPSEKIYPYQADMPDTPLRAPPANLLLRAVAKHNKTVYPTEAFSVTVYSVANAPLQLLWDDPAGNLRTLEATEQTALGYPDSFKWQHDFINRLKNANYLTALERAQKAIDNAKRTSAAVVSAAQEKILKEANARRTGKAQGPFKGTRVTAKAALDRKDVQEMVQAFSKPGAVLPVPQTSSAFPVLVADDDDESSFFTD
jgi:hypothetical protein